MDVLAIQTSSLTKKFGDFTAVDDLNLDVDRGEVYGLLGHNGAGKTTTINMLTGLLTPTGGAATILGHDVAREPLKARRGVGLLPDNTGNYGHLTARQNLHYFAELADVPRDAAAQRITDLLALVGLEDWIDEKAGKYSRGMRRRLGIAQSLMRDPEVLIYDEPTLGIDPEGTRVIRELILRLTKEQGKTVLLSTHLLPEVNRMCDRIGIMRRGRLVAEGTVAELREDAGSDGDLEKVFLRYQGAV
jgi:ABC-2 type transport system ATP-binding protein